MSIESDSQSIAVESKSFIASTPYISSWSYDFLKRSVDILLSSLGIIIFFPLMLIIALCIKLDSSGPVLADIPKRAGKKGKLFKMYKFRSMVVGAHDLLHKDPKFKELLEQYHQNGYKIDNDPRWTRVGKWIRKPSLDEFPQLFNIFKGEMSIVGPRAYYPFELKEQQEKYPQTEKFVKIILQGKPGLTGVWQISGRSEINFVKRVEMDAEYIQRRDILYDIWIILKTIPAVLTGRGAV